MLLALRPNLHMDRCIRLWEVGGLGYKCKGVGRRQLYTNLSLQFRAMLLGIHVYVYIDYMVMDIQ